MGVKTAYSTRHRRLPLNGKRSFAGGGETFTTVDNPPNGVVGTHTSIAIGSDGLPVVSYRDHLATTLKVLKCGTASCGRP